MDPLIDAQIEQAKGLKYLVVREKSTGRFVRVSEGMAKAKEKLKPNEEVIEVWEKDPSIAAFTDLMNRALDKRTLTDTAARHLRHRRGAALGSVFS